MTRFATANPVSGFLAPDNIGDAMDRVERLVSLGRRITMARRCTYQVDAAPTIYTGMVLDHRWDNAIDRWEHRDGSRGLAVRLRNGQTTEIINVSAHASDGRTERAVQDRYERESADGHIRDITRIHIMGDVAGDGRSADDTIVLDAWNSAGVCIQTVVAFDDVRPDPRLTELRNALRLHVDTLADQQPWDNRAMFERLLTGLNDLTTHGVGSNG